MLGKTEAITLAFINGQYAPELSTEAILPKGVFVGTLAEAADALPDVVTARLAKIATLDGSGHGAILA